MQPENLPENNNPIEVVPAVPEGRPSGVWGAWATVGLSLAIFMIDSMAQTIVMVIFAVLQALSEPIGSDLDSVMEFVQRLMTNGDMFSIALIISSLLGVGAAWLFIKLRRGAGFKEYLALRAISLKTVLVLIGVLIALFAVAIGIGQLMNSPEQEDILTQAFYNTTFPPAFWLAIGLIGPFFEEVLFRGFLFAGLLRSRLGAAWTIIITGLVFAMVHAVQYGIGVLVQIFILGVVFGLVRWKTNSLWSSIILHAAWNTAQLVLLALAFNLGV
jgi:membrane protease YdiL (CAAX protease family)